MIAPSESYLKVAYDLRPAKQVQRRMIVDALQIMSRGGFQISDYQYTGFGSIYFVDFILFHRLLGIDKMLNVEYSTKIRKRVKFNRPFKNIDLKFKPISEVIPTLSPDRKHFLWLDYDNILHRNILSDGASAAAQLSAESLLLITVDVEPPDNNTGPSQWMDYFEEEAGSFFGSGWKVNDFVKSNLPSINVSLLYNAIQSGLAGREGVVFIPIFNFLYADKHKMLTLGGMIGTETEMRKLDGCAFKRAPYIRREIEDKPYKINVPKLTRKERLYLDGAMPCEDGWKLRDFELKKEDIEAYREIYRFYPSYVELLL